MKSAIRSTRSDWTDARVFWTTSSGFDKFRVRSILVFVADTLTPEARSALMSRIRGKDTKPERIVRSLLHRMGYRFTVNGPKNRKLPGRPDIVLPKYRTVIFVHGCYWHRHAGCRLAYMPKTRVEFWSAKFEGNVRRDAASQRRLRQMGWHVLTVWECQTRSPRKLEQQSRRIERLLTRNLNAA